MVKQIAFAAVVAFSLGLFTVTMDRMVRIVAMGRPANLKETLVGADRQPDGVLLRPGQGRRGEAQLAPPADLLGLPGPDDRHAWTSR
jgi:hypothetical protein